MTYNGDAMENRRLVDDFTRLNYSYADRRNNVHWRRRSLEITTRDGDQCRRCKHRDTHLHTHHCYYRRYPDAIPACPWDYPTASLVTLCDICHEGEEEYIRPAKREFLSMVRERGGSWRESRIIVNALNNVPAELSIKGIVGAIWAALSIPSEYERLASKFLDFRTDLQLHEHDGEKLIDALSMRGASSRDFGLLLSTLKKLSDGETMPKIAGAIWCALVDKDELERHRQCYWQAVNYSKTKGV